MKRGASAALLAAAALTAGPASPALAQAGGGGLERAEAVLEAGDVEEARRALDAWLADGTDGSARPEEARARYLQGRLSADPEQAEHHYAWVAVEGNARYGALARLALAQLRLARGEPERALEDLDRLRADFPGSDVVPRSWMWTAVAREAAGDAAGACQAWEHVAPAEDPELRAAAAASAAECPGLAGTVSSGGGWSVQLGAFRTAEAAEALRRRAQTAVGVETRVEAPDAAGWHRVRAGRFGAPEEARALAEQLRRRGFEAILVEGP